MLPFTQERLKIRGKTIFYYNRSCFIPEIYMFSNTIFQDLKNYSGIELEISQTIKFSKAVDDDGDQGFYSQQKIKRIQLLYNFYIDSVLKMTQLLYYEDLSDDKLYTFCKDVSIGVQQIYVPNANVDRPAYRANEPQYFQNIIQVITNQWGDDKQVNDKEAFLVYFNATVSKTGRRLQDCYKLALEKCQPFKTMIEQQLDLEFPVETFQDKIVQKEKIFVSKKKTK